MKRFEQFRSARQQVYDKLFSARALCIAGLIIMPALFFNPVTMLRVFQFLFFWFLAWLSGKRNNPVFTILVILGIVIFNLIIPYGQVLFTVGVFKVTSGALAAGIQRAVTLEGLIMLSRFTIRRDLKIPGLFGELIGESFRILSIIMDRKKSITRKNFIADIDRLMLELSGDASNGGEPAGNAVGEPLGNVGGETAEAVKAPAVPVSRTTPAGFIILTLTAILSWLLWTLGWIISLPRH